MTSKITPATNPLQHLLQVFNTESLGEGDLGAGANVLAAMCASIANVNPPGTCLVTEEGNRLPVGMSFAAAGGLTRSLVDGKVIDLVARFQTNLGDHLAAADTHAAAKLAALPEHERIRIRPDPPSGSPVLADLKVEINGLVAAKDSSAFGRLISPCRDQGLEGIMANPAVFLDASDPATLKQELPHVHLSYPFVRAFIPDSNHASQMSRILLSIMHGTGCAKGTRVPSHLRGHVAVTCSIANMGQNVDATEDSLFANLLWLVDGGHCPSSLNGIPDDVAPYRMHERYPDALHKAWTRRLDYRQAQSPSVRYNWEPRQREWVTFLNQLEPLCPGLTLAARPLFATLVYGMISMSRALDTEKPRWSDVGALELAKLLVGRMVECRRRLVETEQDAKIIELAVKLVNKLGAGPRDARELVRKTNGLLIGDCRQALGVLGRIGVAREVAEGKWELSLSAPQAVAKLRAPFIDV